MPHKIIIDTDIGEDIDDILVTAFALNSPEFEVVGITTVAGDTWARSRIARRLAVTCGKPDVQVAAGYPHAMPDGTRASRPGLAVTQGELAPEESDLPPPSPLWADEFIATRAAEHSGELYVLTIGAMTNVGQALVRFPETASHLKAVVTNGGTFDFAGREPGIGWNLRYDPIAAAVVACAPVRWVLLPENACRFSSWGQAEVERLSASRAPLARLLAQAIDLWRRNKPDATKWPHLSDLNVLAYLLGWIPTTPGRVSLKITPGRLPELGVERDPDGPHLLGAELPRDKGEELRALLMERLLATC